MKLLISLEAPHVWVILNKNDQIVDEGEVLEFDQYKLPANIDQVIGVAPGESIVTRSVLIPGNKKKDVQTAIPYALEESLADDIESLHFKLLEWSPGNSAITAIVSKEQLKLWIEQFSQYGVPLDIILPEYLLLPRHRDQSITVSKSEDNSIAVRTDHHLGFTLDADSFAYWWESLDKTDVDIAVTHLGLAKELKPTSKGQVSHWEIGAAFPQWLKLSESIDGFEQYSVLAGQFKPSHHSQHQFGYKLAAALMIGGLVFYGVATHYEYSQLKSEKQQLDNQIRTLFAESFPNEPYLDNPRHQVESLIRSAESKSNRISGFNHLLNVVSQVTPQLNAEIIEINYRENELILLCAVTNLSALDQIVQSLTQREGVSAELISSGSQNDKITGRFRIKRV